jgi:hypothetical protein
MTRWGHEHLLERRQQRVAAHPAIRNRRKQMGAHPVGTSKHWHDHGDFLLKGLATGRAEFSWSTLADNLRRVVTIRGVPHRLRALA